MALRQRHTRAGFTLVETLCALLLTAIVTLSIVTLYRTHQDTHTLNSRRMALQAELRKAMAVVTSEIRSAGFDPSEMAGAGIVIADVDFLYFTRDLDGDGRMDQGTGQDPGEHVAFCHYVSDGRDAIGRHSGGQGGGRCSLSSSGSGSDAADCPGPAGNYHNPLAEGINLISFRYYTMTSNGSWQELPADTDRVAAPQKIHRIDVTLAGGFDHKGRQIRRELTESALLRSHLF